MKITGFIIGLFASLVMLMGASGQAAAYNLFGAACNNAGNPNVSSSSVCTDAKNQTTDNNPVVRIIGDAARIISLIVGFVAVILIVVSGLTLITSGGNAEAVKGAKSRITGAVVGLVLAALAYTIASFVVSRLV